MKSQFTEGEQVLAEVLREQRLQEINSAPTDREKLEAVYGQVWDTDQLRQEFEVMGFGAPFVVARRKSDQKLGSLEFQHHPRFFFNWKEDQ